MTKELKPFTLNIPQAQLDALEQRLEYTRWPERETVEDWSQGVPLSYAKELRDYWLHSYNWRRLETRLNQWPMFTTLIDGVEIHFLHIQSAHDDALPMIMTHGWPGSIVEFHKVIGPLTDPMAYGANATDAFHLVLPSLPGFGFSGKPAEAGWNPVQVGRAWGKLMAKLGYGRYVAQGGDWGSIVTSSMGSTETIHCAGIHLNMVIPPSGDEIAGSSPTNEEKVILDTLVKYEQEGAGYRMQQCTRPQTLGYGLTDSPMGQATWIIEKFYEWMDCGDGAGRHPENILSKDELLDNVMMYWLPGTATSSGRMYWEFYQNITMDEVTIPTGVSIFPKEVFRSSRRWVEKRYTNLSYWNELDRGGHFAALEQPELFVEELRRCFRGLRV